MSDFQLRYSGAHIAGLETAVRAAVRGVSEAIDNDMAVLTKNTNDAHAVRKQRKWYQFWNHWWDWDVLPYQLSDMGQWDRQWKCRSHEDLLDLQYKLEKLTPTEVILTERLSNLITRYAKL